MNITFEVYSPFGVKVTITEEVADLSASHGLIAATLRSGYTVEPVLRKQDTITTVMRRKHVDDNGHITPVIDMFGERAQFRFVGHYLNTPEDVAQFEAISGLILEQIPLYTSAQPLKRKLARADECEVRCAPFVAFKREDGIKNINGVEQMTYKFAGYGATTPAPVPAAQPALLPTGRMMTDPTPPPDAPRRGQQLPPPGAVNPAVKPTASFPLRGGRPR